MAKKLIFYDIATVAFPLCGFLEDDQRQFLLDLYKEKKQEAKEDTNLYYEMAEDHFCIIDFDEIINALENPLDIDMNKVPAALFRFDVARAIAYRESWIANGENGEIIRTTPDMDLEPDYDAPIDNIEG